jgi:hypothetical protein
LGVGTSFGTPPPSASRSDDRRKVKSVGAATAVYVTDADNREVLKYDGASGQILRWNAYGLGPNDVLNQMNVAASTRATFIPDIQGSMLATLGSSSGALTKNGYLPYGKSASVPTSFDHRSVRSLVDLSHDDARKQQVPGQGDIQRTGA